MKKEEFLLQLRKSLSKLPQNEVDDALEYYEEYLNEAGTENEEATIASWDSPERIASQITAEYAMKQLAIEPSAKKGLSTVWLVLLAIFASPVAIPLAASLAAVVFALLVVLISLIFSLACISVSFAAGGIMSVIVGFCLIAQSTQTAALYIGTGLFLAGAGAALFPCVILLSKKGFHAIATLCSKYLPRRSLK